MKFHVLAKRQNTPKHCKGHQIRRFRATHARTETVAKNHEKRYQKHLKMFRKSMKNHGWENLCKIMQNGTKKGNQKTVKIPKTMKINTPKTMEQKTMQKHAKTCHDRRAPTSRCKVRPRPGGEKGVTALDSTPF